MDCDFDVYLSKLAVALKLTQVEHLRNLDCRWGLIVFIVLHVISSLFGNGVGKRQTHRLQRDAAFISFTEFLPEAWTYLVLLYLVFMLGPTLPSIYSVNFHLI